MLTTLDPLRGTVKSAYNEFSIFETEKARLFPSMLTDEKEPG